MSGFNQTIDTNINHSTSITENNNDKMGSTKFNTIASGSGDIFSKGM